MTSRRRPVLKKVAVVLALLGLCLTVGAASSTATGDKITGDTTAVAVGGTVNVTWHIDSASPSDYVQMVRSDGVRVWALYAANCSPGTLPAAGKVDGSCPFPVVAGGTTWSGYTAPSPVGTVTINYYSGAGTLKAQTAPITVTATAVACPSAGNGGTPPAVPQNAVYAAMGDSLTSGNRDRIEPPWPVFLQIARGQVDYVNNGVGGQTVAQMVAQLPTVLAEPVSVVFVFGGTNDVQYNLTPANEIVCNIDRIVGEITAAGKIPVLIGPAPRDFSATASSAQKTQLLADYRTALAAYATSHAVPYVDIWPALANPANPSLMLPSLTGDGIHPNAHGALIVAETIASRLGWVWP